MKGFWISLGAILLTGGGVVVYILLNPPLAPYPPLDDPRVILSLTEAEVIERFGRPTDSGDVNPTTRQLRYTEPGCMVFFEHGRAVSFAIIGDSSTLTIDAIIGIGSDLQEVTSFYGEVKAEKEVPIIPALKEDRVLYHCPETPSVRAERFAIHFHEHDLIVWFNPERQVHSIWIGKDL